MSNVFSRICEAFVFSPLLHDECNIRNHFGADGGLELVYGMKAAVVDVGHGS